MRFEADGPDIPDDLLTARDNDEVVFFCGAGVSKHEAGGPTFWELAQRVVDDLRPARNSPARQLLELSGKVTLPPGVGGLPPADRLFALLEQDFAVSDVRAAVARAVCPANPAALGAHHALLDLARTPDGALRLVTTNFDQLFQAADPNLEYHLPPALPDPRRPELWRGLVYLHGRVAADYADADRGDFVLSSADFGRAYMSDGWATAFMRSLIDHYRIVFVGYSADDPPVQYLLEAISRTRSSAQLYAFHDGAAEQAAALWRHKGVKPIPFEGFPTLWRSLDAWACRARDPTQWRSSVVSLAQRGPRNVLPHERGQVAHLVSSLTGMNDFSRADPPPSAEWLCVFDPSVRFVDEQLVELYMTGNNERQKLYDSYHLDNDPTLEPSTRRNVTPIPNGAWSALEALPSDLFHQPSGPRSGLRGHLGTMPPPLTRRLGQLTVWIRRIVGDPLAVWWAAGQNGLHPNLREAITYELDKSMPDAVRAAWRQLLSPSVQRDQDGSEQYSLLRLVQKDGWSSWLLREMAELQKPFVAVSRPTTAPPISGEITTTRLVNVRIVYPQPIAELEVPPDLLGEYVKILRQHIDLTAELEAEARGYPMLSSRPIVPYDDPASSFAHAIYDLPAMIVRLARHVERLIETDPDKARSEVAAWPSGEHVAFTQLRLWAAGRPELITVGQAENEFRSISHERFWRSGTQRDLLVALASRWTELGDDVRQSIEEHILAGPDKWSGVDDDRYEKIRAFEVLNRLYWIEQNGLQVTFDLAAERAKLMQIVPDWTTEDGIDQIDRSSSRGGMVATDTRHDMLEHVPLGELLDAADTASGRGRDFLVDRRPFSGWAETHPVRAFAALVKGAKKGEKRPTYWNDFLWAQNRAEDRT